MTTEEKLANRVLKHCKAIHSYPNGIKLYDLDEGKLQSLILYALKDYKAYLSINTIDTDHGDRRKRE